MVQWFSTGYSSQQPHGDSQLSIVESDALLWHKGIHANGALIHIYKTQQILKKGTVVKVI